jgi:hypothetical protein
MISIACTYTRWKPRLCDRSNSSSISPSAVVMAALPVRLPSTACTSPPTSSGAKRDQLVQTEVRIRVGACVVSILPVQFAMCFARLVLDYNTRPLVQCSALVYM